MFKLNHKLFSPEGDPPPSDPPPSDPPPASTPPSDPPPSDPPPSDQPPAWVDSTPDDWREQLAGGDESRLKQLGRVTDVKKLVDNYFEAQQKIRSGEIAALQAPDENSTDEEWSQYRDAMGIPETSEAYELELEDGLVFGDDDNEIMPAIYEAAHKHNIPAAALTAVANAMLKGRELQNQKFETKNNEDQRNATAVLKDTWRGDYDTNINLIRNSIIGAMPESVRDAFGQAMLPDGTKIFNSPDVMAVMADWARQLNPAATVVPGDANPVKTIKDEIAALEAKMGTPEWYKDTTAQARYQELVAAREKLG